MKSIVDSNREHFGRKHNPCPKLAQIDAADATETKFLAMHHISCCIQENLARLRSSIALQSNYAQRLAKLLPERRWLSPEIANLCWWARETTICLFRQCTIMPRLYAGIAAIEKMAGGRTPPSISRHIDQIWSVFKKMDRVHAQHYALDSKARARTPLAPEMMPLVDNLEAAIRTLYAEAQQFYGLCNLYGGAK